MYVQMYMCTYLYILVEEFLTLDELADAAVGLDVARHLGAARAARVHYPQPLRSDHVSDDGLLHNKTISDDGLLCIR